MLSYFEQANMLNLCKLTRLQFTFKQIEREGGE
jgi:hypothetical protein